MTKHFKSVVGIPLLALILVCAGACAWQIFTVGTIDTSASLNDSDSLPITCQDASMSLHRVGYVYAHQGEVYDWSILVLTPPAAGDQEYRWAPVLDVFSSSTWSPYVFELVDEELTELVEIEIGELLEDVSPWRMYWFQMREP